MKFFYLFIILMFSTVCCVVNGQEKFKAGLSFGINLNHTKQNLSNRVASEYSGENGIYVNVHGEYRFYGPLYISPGISFIQKNFKFERTGDEWGDVYTDYKADYLNFPVLAGLYILNPDKQEGLRMKMGIGGYLGYWLGLKRKGQYPSFSRLYVDENGMGKFPLVSKEERYDFVQNENNYNRFDYGLQGEIKILYGVSKSVDLSLGYSLLYGLSGIHKEEKNQNPMYHTSHVLSFGVSYKFRSKKKDLESEEIEKIEN